MSLQEERKHSINLSDISSAEAHLGLCKTSIYLFIYLFNFV